MTDLFDLVASLKREVAVPGTFAATYPGTADSDLVGSLMDAFSGVQLEGYLGALVLDLDAETVVPDLSSGARALVVLYAAERILVARILAMRTRTLYEAGPTKYETENAATVLTGVLKMLTDRKKALLATVAEALRARTPIYMGDVYSDRLSGVEFQYIGLTYPDTRLRFFDYELLGG